jgi:glutamate synthase domain-containing protein 3
VRIETDQERQPHRRCHALRAKSPSATATRACRTTPSTSRLRGTAGQSFGAWLAHGVTIELSARPTTTSARACPAARIIYPPAEDSGIDKAEDNIIVGNTVLYGAISGECYFRGVAGERFACATPAPARWSKASATTAANT